MNSKSKSFISVKNRELSSSKSQPAILCGNVEPTIISWPANTTCRPRTNSKDSSNKCVQRSIPVVPINSINNSAISDIVGLAQQFSSTTFVNGAMKDEATTFNDPLSKCKNPDETYLNSKYLNGEDQKNLETVEVPVDTFISADNEIKTIQIGNFSNVISADTDSTTEETYIASTDSSGICYVTVQKSKVDITAEENYVSIPLTPAPVTKSLPITRGSCFPKRGIILYGKSRMIADTHTNITVREFKAQLNDTSDIIGQMEIAPPTKYYMYTLNTKGVNKLFANPGRPMSFTLSKSYSRHLTMKQIQEEQTFSDLELQPLGFTSRG